MFLHVCTSLPFAYVSLCSPSPLKLLFYDVFPFLSFRLFMFSLLSSSFLPPSFVFLSSPSFKHLCILCLLVLLLPFPCFFVLRLSSVLFFSAVAYSYPLPSTSIGGLCFLFSILSFLPIFFLVLLHSCLC